MALNSREGLNEKSGEFKAPYEHRLERLALKVSITTPLQAAEQSNTEAEALKLKYGERYQGFKAFVERYQASWSFPENTSHALAQYETIHKNLAKFDRIFESFKANQNNPAFINKLGLSRMVEPQHMIETALRGLVSDPSELSLIGLFALIKANGTPLQRTLQNTWATKYFVASSIPAMVGVAELKTIL